MFIKKYFGYAQFLPENWRERREMIKVYLNILCEIKTLFWLPISMENFVMLFVDLEICRILGLFS